MIKNSNFCILFLFCLRGITLANENYTIDATSISLEELVNTKFIPATAIANQMNNAASAVSIVTAQDIKDYGYKSLKEILSSMKGLHFTKDEFYSFLGGRGFSSPSEYAGRIIVLIDGYRADDGYFGQTYFEHDGILDTSMIERVEFVPSGGSAGYSNGALLGVINIITKNGSDIDGTKVALGFGSRHGEERRVSAGAKFDNGADILLLASTFEEHNKNFKYQDIFQDAGEQSNKRLFLKAKYNNITLTSAYAKRKLDVAPFPPFGVLSDDTLDNIDENFFTNLKYDTDITSNLKLSSSIWYGLYSYYYLDDVEPEYFTLMGRVDAKWYGADMKFVGTWFDNHTLSFGLDYRNDFRWRQRSQTYTPDYGTYNEFNSYGPRKTYSAYIYDDFKLSDTMSLNYGFRQEKNDNKYNETSPYGAFIWQVLENTRLKLSASEVLRQATAFEGYKEKSEKASTLEFVLEQKLGYETKLTSSVYKYEIENSYEFSSQDIEAKGFEIEFEKHWINGVRLRTSYAWQDSRNKSDNQKRVNSPRNIAKLNLSTPIINKRLRLGVEAQHVGKRLMTNGTIHEGECAKAYTIANINVTARELLPNLDVSLKVHNIFNKHYDNVLTFSTFDQKSTLSDDGRVIWLQLEYTFK